MIYALYWSRKMNYALRPESFCALNFAIRKVQTFGASAIRFGTWQVINSELNLVSLILCTSQQHWKLRCCLRTFLFLFYIRIIWMLQIKDNATNDVAHALYDFKWRVCEAI